MKFYKCNHCGNIIAYVENKNVPVVCCGEKMQELIPGVVEASAEKHIPEVSVKGNVVTVKVGSVAHPMEEKHYIQWIAIETKEGNQRKVLKAGQEPIAKFSLSDNDKFIAAYEYCNLHGLWKYSGA